MKTIFPFRLRLPRKAVAILLPVLLFLFGWWFGLPAPRESGPDAASAISETIWTCSMHPQIRQPEPGLCPICAMDLIPLEGGESGGLREVSVSAEASALLDLRVAPVRSLSETDHHSIRVFGRIAHNERRTTSISSRIGGRIEKLFIDYTGIHVHEGEPLAELYSPQILLAQKELIEARDAMEGGPEALRATRRKIYEAALRKLELLEISPLEISRILAAEAPSDRIIIRAPQSGRVTTKEVSQGDYIETGERLFTISDHSTVWLNLEVYEEDLPFMEEGLPVEFTIEAIPGEVFSGEIAYIDHLIDPRERISRVRVDVKNTHDKIKPGMFAKATVIAPSIPLSREAEEEWVTIPGSSVLRTGERAVVYVRLPGTEPVFEGREVLLGGKVGSRRIVVSGLRAGELVVANGAFKLDSELQLKARPSMMNPDAGLQEKPAHEAPEDLAGQWRPVLRALGRLEAAVETPAILAEISAMELAVEKVSTETFQPELLHLWSEFSNRLLIDFRRAREVLPDEPDQAKSVIRRSLAEAGRYLGLPAGARATPQMDAAAAERLKKLVVAYLPVAKALALDDPQAAAEAARTFAEEADDDLRLHQPAVAISAAGELGEQRRAFEQISNELISQIRAEGLDRVGDAYVIHCPMVDSNSGADWISTVPRILNPYYGASMLDCGSISETLSLEK